MQFVRKKYGNESERAKTFLAELHNVCKEHGYEVGHEDTQGEFLIRFVGRGKGSGFDAAECEDDL